VLCLISGGGSALLALPGGDLNLADKQAINRALLKSGAHIGEMNCVRKHLSAIKGGRLAAAAMPARVVSLIISDVPGDDLSIIASGPTVADASTQADARRILAKYGIAMSERIARHLADPGNETPKPGDRAFDHVSNVLIATPQDSLEAAAAVAREAGFAPLILGNAIAGEARECAIVHAGIALQAAGYSQPIAPPCAIISGGETTVTVRGKGRGGRNAEFLLGLAIALQGRAGISALAADTDGIDGSEDNAGAIIDPETIARAAEARLDVAARLADNDAYSVFSTLGDLVVTGPTLTNVNDFRVMLAPRREP
jgi:hydroxypyruvate reductase